MTEESEKMFSLDGKVAVVTGCSTGIGQGLVCGLAKAGADIAALDIADLGETEDLVKSIGSRFKGYKVDLSDIHEIDRVWEQVMSDFGHVDILFNNAGMQYRMNAFAYPAEMFDKIIAVNLRSGYILSQKAANHYKDRKYPGKIINTASLFSTFGGVNVSGYTCSKHGVMGMTKAMSNEFAPYGICVNAIAPGYIETNLTKSIWSDPEKRKPMDERLPINRWGKPKDFEGVAVFLASHASDYITGVVIPVDGGYTER